jgi:hypothetical protein
MWHDDEDLVYDAGDLFHHTNDNDVSTSFNPYSKESNKKRKVNAVAKHATLQGSDFDNLLDVLWDDRDIEELMQSDFALPSVMFFGPDPLSDPGPDPVNFLDLLGDDQDIEELMRSDFALPSVMFFGPELRLIKTRSARRCRLCGHPVGLAQPHAIYHKGSGKRGTMEQQQPNEVCTVPPDQYAKGYPLKPGQRHPRQKK